MTFNEGEEIAEDIVRQIRRGAVDDYHYAIYDALIARSKRLARKLFQQLQVGDQVRISGKIKPKYMAGRIGVVVEKRQSKVEVDFGEPIGRFGSRVIVPSSAISEIVTAKKDEV